MTEKMPGKCDTRTLRGDAFNYTTFLSSCKGQVCSLTRIPAAFGRQKSPAVTQGAAVARLPTLQNPAARRSVRRSCFPLYSVRRAEKLGAEAVPSLPVCGVTDERHVTWCEDTAPARLLDKVVNAVVRGLRDAANAVPASRDGVIQPRVPVPARRIYHATAAPE